MVHRDGPDHAAPAGSSTRRVSDRGAPSHPEAALRPGAGPHIIEWTAEAGSTNERLAALLEAGGHFPDFAVVGTDHQVAGRGRLDRAWSVPAGKALTCSFAVRVPEHAAGEVWGWLPVVTGLAVHNALAEAGVASQIKWPNDVLVDGRKICGILARVVTTPTGPAVVIGTGINLTLTAADLRDGGVPDGYATSVLLEGGDPDRDRFLTSLAEHLRTHVSAVVAAGAAATGTSAATAARAAMATLDSQVRVHLPGGRLLVGTAVGLDAQANLQVRPEGSTGAAEPITVSAGDVVHVRPA